MEVMLPKFTTRQPITAAVKSRASVDLRGLRLRKSLRFRDTGHLIHCLQAKPCDAGAEESKRRKREDDYKDVQKLMKSKRKVLKGVKEERRRFAKLVESLKCQGVPPADVDSALMQFSALESSLQQMLTATDPKFNESACMDSSSSSSSESEDDEMNSEACTAPAAMPLTIAAPARASPNSSDISGMAIPELVFAEGLSSASLQLPGMVLVCQGKKCSAAGSRDILAEASRLAAGSPVEVLPCKCLGKCKQAPAIRMQAGDGAALVQTNVVLSQLHETLQATFTADSSQNTCAPSELFEQVDRQDERQLVCV